MFAKDFDIPNSKLWYAWRDSETLGTNTENDKMM